MILALSTSTPRATVALLDGRAVVAERSYEDPKGHAERIFDLVDEVLSVAGAARPDIHLVACDIGPGSFTGVRIAVASAKGIALGLGIPLAGVVSLEAMRENAAQQASAGMLIVTAIDAKKGELYVAVFDGAAQILAPCHLPLAVISERIVALTQGRPFVSIVDAPELRHFAPGSAHALVAPPDAAHVGLLAASRPLPTEEIVPLYVRPPDAVPSFSGSAIPFAMLPPQ